MFRTRCCFLGEETMTDSFLYIWTDKLNDMFYIGIHKGTIDDGYICSSKFMLEEYNKRPEDFHRYILKYGTIREVLDLENKLLKKVDAKNNKKYYNRHNGDGLFAIGLPQSKESNEKRGRKLKGKVLSAETKKKMSDSKKGQIPWNKGKKNIYSKETLEKMSKSANGFSEKAKKNANKFQKGRVPWNKGISKLPTEEFVRKP